MEKFNQDASRNAAPGRARETSDRLLRLPRRPDLDLNRQSVIQERGCAGIACGGNACAGNAYGGNACAGIACGGNACAGNTYGGNACAGSACGGGAFNCSPSPVPKRRVLERKRRYQFDADAKGSGQEQRGSPRKKPFECSDMRKALSMSGLSAPASEVPPPEFAPMPYVCDECGREFAIISEFVEHQIMHTRENLYEYGEAFIRSASINRKNAARGKCYECKECGEAFDKSAELAEHCQLHARERQAEGNDENEEPFLPSPTFSELQRMYGKDKFYQCKVCKESFLHSSALAEHQQKAHGRGDKEGEGARPNPAFQELQRMYALGAKEKMYECKVCGETFRQSSSLKDHQKTHSRANPFENKGKVAEETFTPGPSLRRRPGSYSQEQPYGGGRGDAGAYGQPPYFGEPPAVPLRNHLYGGGAYGSSVIRSAPFPGARRSHTITRPPEDEDEKPFTISSNPDDSQKPSTKLLGRKLNERSVILSLSFAGAPKSHSAGGPTFAKPKPVASATVTSASLAEQNARAAEKTSEEKQSEGSVIHSPPVFKLPRIPAARERHERGGSSNLNDRQQKTFSRASPKEMDKNNNYKDSVIRRVSGAEAPKSLGAEGAVEIKQEGASASEHQKARAKKKNIERGAWEPSVIHSLPFGEPEAFRPREKLYECPECGEAFVRSSDLAEHQKTHHRKKPLGNGHCERSVIRSLAAAAPRASYADQAVQVGYDQEPEGLTCIQQPGQRSLLEQIVGMSFVKEPVQRYAEEPEGRARMPPPPPGMTCIQQPAGMTCMPPPEGRARIQPPAGMTCIQPPAGMTCMQQPPEGRARMPPPPPGMTCIQPPAGMTCMPPPEGRACIQPPPGMTCIQQPAGMTCIQPSAGMTCMQQPPEGRARMPPPPPGMTCIQPPAGMTCIQQPRKKSFLEDLVEMSYVQEPVETYGRRPVELIHALQPGGRSALQQPAQASRPRQPVGMSRAEQPAQTSYAPRPVPGCKDCGQAFAATEALGPHEKIYACEEFHGGSVIRGAGRGQSEYEEPEEEEEEEDPEDSIYGCKDCGLGFADRADLKDHQKVHGREYLVDTREYAQSAHTHSVSEYQRENTGEQLFECPACGESFVHSSFLFEHQKVHEQDPYYGHQRYSEPFMHAFASPQRFRAPQAHPTGMYLQCHVCGQDFIHGSVFNEHLALHAGEGPQEQAPRGSGAAGAAGAAGAGLALAQLQRSPEEKRHVCGVCGEAFPSRAALREHRKAHEKDAEPYDYGASFVHTSFLTEPPRGVSPFFECKDCGQSFIHNTVLASHQKSHEEEEEGAAAAPEVEADALIPRQVLRIQSSNVEAAEPEVEAAEPSVEAAEPSVEAAEPNGEAEGPEGEAAEPDGEAEQPDSEAEQPQGDADEPDGVGIEDPEEREEELEGKADEPEEDADEPDGEGFQDPEEEEEEDDDDEEIQVEEPYYDCRECGETFTTTSAYGEHRQGHARVIIFEPGSGYGEGSRPPGPASTSTSTSTLSSDKPDDKAFKCDVCGQLFRDRLSLARHQNTHTG